jgi:uncharacterized hydrophobic protein (TIGR00271 family)
MLQRDPREATAYWLQLVVSVGIATLGLVLGSTAVVIGAMLIAPLMGPIVAMGMGLATGSPFLVLRSSGRVAVSVGLAIFGSAAIVLLLPFHELNAEIAARTTPTVLDLITAGFCALAGVYAVMRRGSDTASTAAGTAIGISLVPPLGASGYGVGILNGSIAGGAALLFLTNFVAIVLVGTIAFVMAGFNQVDVRSLEAKAFEAGDSPIARGLSQRLSQVFTSRQGPWLRFLMPVLLLAIVYVPLRSALDEMAWQVRVRSQVETALGRLPQRVLESRVRIERRGVETFVVVLGSTRDAETARTKLDVEIRRAAGVVPRIDVLAVPDARALAGLELALTSKSALPPPPPPPTPAETLNRSRELVMSALGRRWPARSAGQPLQVALELDSGTLSIAVAHLGSAMDAIARETLERALAQDLGGPVSLHVKSLPPEEISAGEDAERFALRLATLLELSRDVDGVSVCIVRPAEIRGRKRSRDALALQATISELVSSHPRAGVAAGEALSARIVRGECPAGVTTSTVPLEAAR